MISNLSRSRAAFTGEESMGDRVILATEPADGMETGLPMVIIFLFSNRSLRPDEDVMIITS